MGASLSNSDHDFAKAIKNDDLNFFKSYNNIREIINYKDDKSMTLLMYASAKCKNDIVKFLIDSGADINAQDDMGSTALLFAVRYGYNEGNCVKLLVDAGARNIKNNSGNTPLAVAMDYECNNYVKIIR